MRAIRDDDFISVVTKPGIKLSQQSLVQINKRIRQIKYQRLSKP